ncbi:STAS domain-containing protein [Streptomyces sp. CB02400]|uniref:STAS domain-containing protein n=1 Tax=unclassified Streptomyces TaxID=2593676 RepID=UPI001F21106F|nr:STAS domain-containing protein [Streptomyces sp. CB02400]
MTADRHLVTVAGDLDLYTARRLADALQPLLQREGQAVLAGLPGVTFLDSTRLTRLITAYRTARSAGAHLALVAPGQPVQCMLELVGAGQVLAGCPTLDAASH